MSEKTSNCPFCGSETWGILQGGRWLICGQHKQDCPIGCNGGLVANSLDDWNRRTTQPAAGEPVAVIDVNAIADYVADYWPMKKHSLEEIEAGLRSIVLETAPPAAAHGDEAVSMKLIGESHEEQGVVWTGPNPHAWPAGTKFYAMRAQAGEGGE